MGHAIVAGARAGDVIGRSIYNAAIVEKDTFSFSSFSGSHFDVTPGTVNLLLGTIGAKIQVGGLWLLAGSVAFPMNSNGVKPGVTPVIAFERAF